MKRILFVSGWAHPPEYADGFCHALSEATGLACDRVSPAALIAGCVAPVSQSAYSREILALLDRHTTANWIGVGWSLGALCLLEASIERPSAFSAIVGLGATASFCSRRGYDGGVPAERVQAMLATLGKKPALVLKSFFRDVHFPAVIPIVQLHSLMESAQRLPPHVLEHGLSYLIETDLRQSCERISVPVLLCHGQQDRIVPPDGARFCAGRIPGCILREFPGQGHYLFDSPSCIDNIGAFLSGKGLR